MNIASAIFDRSAPALDSCPDESLPEFAFIGRSNVGKSSLLNLLAGGRKLARVSPTPGFTKMINFFTVNKTWRLVDLPGYGFAQVARKDKAKFNQAVADYLQERPNLCCVFALIDSSLPPQQLDLEFVEWLADSSVPFVLVFTKIDKSSKAAVQANIDAFKGHIAEWCETLPEVYLCSSTERQGRADLLKVIELALADWKSIPAVEPEVAPEPEEPAPEEPATEAVPAYRKAKNRPSKLTRPW
ncbi:MAG: YihA family ribosome biogenesis GTP-binding protein [Proteobacteria bacterium]|nr:YihA family ribosome biogenesis GTP-binding protein [Pseudomonadota bacterium]